MSKMEATGPNRDQIEFWNGKISDIWIESQERLDASIASLTAGVVGAAGVKPGERVLDVGCGCGTTTIEMAELGARVTGIDISGPMLERARVRAAGRSDIDFILADASSYAFTPEFDLLFSRFGVMFFADPVAAFGNVAGALKARGRLCFLCWQPPDQNPWISIPGRIAQSMLPPSDPVDPRSPGMFAFADADYVGDVLNRAGFSDVSIEPFEGSNKLGADLDEAIQFLSRVGPLNRLLEPLESEQREEILDAVRAGLTPYEKDGGVVLGAGCWIVGARVP